MSSALRMKAVVLIVAHSQQTWDLPGGTVLKNLSAKAGDAIDTG